MYMCKYSFSEKPLFISSLVCKINTSISKFAEIWCNKHMLISVSEQYYFLAIYTVLFRDSSYD